MTDGTRVPPCRKCGQALSPDPAGTSRAVWACPGCGALAPGGPASGPGRPVPRLCSERRERGRLRLVIPWFEPSGLLALGACAGVAWWVWGGIQESGAETRAAADLLRLGFGVLVAFLLAYVGAALVVNRTVIEVDAGMLRVRHGPIPWRKGVDLPGADVQQVYGVRARPKGVKNPRTWHYHLFAETGAPEPVALLGDLRSEQPVLWCEERIESFLQIADRRIPGELRKDPPVPGA